MFKKVVVEIERIKISNMGVKIRSFMALSTKMATL